MNECACRLVYEYVYLRKYACGGVYVSMSLYLCAFECEYENVSMNVYVCMCRSVLTHVCKYLFYDLRTWR